MSDARPERGDRGERTGEYAYYDSQPKVLAAVGLVIRDADDGLLVVRPQYKSAWHLVGGLVEADESPRAAARRESVEEIGVPVSVGRLLCVDHKSATLERPACLQLLFDGGVLDATQVAALSVDPGEIAEHRFVPSGEAVRLVEPGGPAARLANALAALRDGVAVYLEDGELP